MLRDRNLRNDERWQIEVRSQLADQKAIFWEWLNAKGRHGAASRGLALEAMWAARSLPINAKPKKPTKGRKSLNKRDKLN